MAVVIACIALVVAIGVVPWAWVWLLQRGREALLAEVDEKVDVAYKEVKAARRQLEISQENYDTAVASYRTMRDRAQAQFLTADSDAGRAERRQDELERYTKRSLEYHATTAAKPLILRGGLYVQQLAALDVVLPLADKFLGAAGADLMYRQEDGPDGSMFYLRWPLEKTPRDVLDSLTRSAHYGSDPAGGSDGSTTEPPVTELQAVLAALRDGGLGVLYLGPLILLRTEKCIQAGFLSPTFHCLTEAQKRKAVNGPNPNDPNDPSLMADLGVAVFLEFKL